MEVILGMPFLTLSNVNKLLTERKLVWRTYRATKTLLTTQRVEIINKKIFAVMALNEEDETFMVHMAAFIVGSNVPLSREAQIILLYIKKVIIPSRYTDYTDVSLTDSAGELLE